MAATGGVRGASLGTLTLDDGGLGATTQALTQVSARPESNDVLVELQMYDSATRALEAQLNLRRDEACLELWRRREGMGDEVDAYEYDCCEWWRWE